MLRRCVTPSRREFLQAGAVAMIGAESGVGRAVASGMAQSSGRPNPQVASVKALVFDTFGTVVDLEPAEVMMVAAHSGDLRAARDVGLRTAFVTRLLDFGPNGKPDLKADSPVDLSAKDFNDLASQMGT